MSDLGQLHFSPGPNTGIFVCLLVFYSVPVSMKLGILLRIRQECKL